MKELIIKKVKNITSIIGTIIILVILISGSVKLFSIFSSSEGKKEIVINEGDFRKSTVNEQMVMEIIRNSGDLVTKEVGYIVQENYEKHRELLGHKVPFTTDESVIAFQGTIGIGIDITDVKIDINNTTKIITLSLPSPKCIYNEIDNDSLFTTQTKDSIFTEYELDELAEIELNFQRQKENELLSDGQVYHQATSQAENLLRDL